MTSIVQPLLPEKRHGNRRSFGKMWFVLAQLFCKWISTSFANGKYAAENVQAEELVNAKFAS